MVIWMRSFRAAYSVREIDEIEVEEELAEAEFVSETET